MTELDLRQQLRYRTLAAFRLTVETRSATRAAEVLGITQPAVSQILAGLERAVGVPLFARGAGRRLEPTAAAERMMVDVKRVLDAMAHLEGLLAGMTEPRPGGRDPTPGRAPGWNRQAAE